jgi:hypothetical protein
MIRKMPVRSIAARLPMGSDYYKGTAVEDAQHEGKSAAEVLDAFTDGEASRTEESAERAASMRAQVDDAAEVTEDEARAIREQEARDAARQ